jgi:hypothetical protein
LTVGSAVIDDGKPPELEPSRRVAAQRGALPVVVRHHAEGGTVTLARVAYRGRDRQLRNAGIGIDLRRRDADSGIEVSRDGAHAGVDQPLGDDRAGARVGLVVLGDELEAHRPLPDARGARVELVHRHARAVEIVLPVVRLRPGQRGGEAYLHDLLLSPGERRD